MNALFFFFAVAISSPVWEKSFSFPILLSLLKDSSQRKVSSSPIILFFCILFDVEIEILADLLRKTRDLGEKQELLLSLPLVSEALSQGWMKPFLPQKSDLSTKIALYSVIAIEQHEILFARHLKDPPKEKIKKILNALVAIDRFYESIGGIVGYQVQVLKNLCQNKEEAFCQRNLFSKASGIDLTIYSEEVKSAISFGIEAMPELAEIYPIGGLGTRLNLLSKSKDPLPAAYLPFCGRSLLEGLVRDVQAKEFLYYRLNNCQVTVPIALMTSEEKRNKERIRTLCEKQKWFGRAKESFFLFSQASVPVVTQEGRWSMKGPLEMNLQPGGHGALWKAAVEANLFFWLQIREKKHLLIRQINNPIAGLDFGLLALVGVGKKEQKTFGFASCERLPNTAEGVLVFAEEEGKKRLSNIEYTDFKRYGIEDSQSSQYLANTNILYTNLEKILPVLKKNPLPGLILNMKNKEPYLCPKGEMVSTIGGRLESMMQNISDSIKSDSGGTMNSFLTYNERRKTISCAKKSFEEAHAILETPVGAYYDLLYNAHALLKNGCGALLSPFCTQEDYLKKGPSHLFLYHPALGPLYTLIAQKLKALTLADQSEMQLEIADVYFEQLKLDGSFIVYAENILGHSSQGIIRYSQKTGKCILKNVSIKNRGINRKKKMCYWKNQIKREECLSITLQGHSEFFAENVTFNGEQKIVVPHGERWVASQNSEGTVTFHVEKPSWRFLYKEEASEIKLKLA